jgi:WD40 repeat protein
MHDLASVVLGLLVLTSPNRSDAEPPERQVKPRAVFGWHGLGETDTAYGFSPDSRLLAVGGLNELLLRDVKSGKVLFDLSEELVQRDYYVVSLAFSPDGKVLAIGCDGDGVIRFWDVANRKWGAVFKGHTARVAIVAFSPDGKLLASGSDDGTLRLWDVATEKERTQHRPHGDWVSAVAFSPDGKALASAGANKDIVLWDVATGKQRQTLRGHENAIDRLAFSSDGKRLASGGRDDTSKLWDLAAGKEVRAFPGPLGRLSPDGRYWIAPRWNGLEVRDVSTGAFLLRVRSPGGFNPVSMALSPDRQTLAVRSQSERIFLWDLERLLPPKP